MGMKIKWNDDRIRAAAAAVLLIGHARLARGETAGLVTAALAEFRADPDDYKASYPVRTITAAKESVRLPDGRRHELYLRLVAAVEALVARVERNKTQFSSLAELDNFFAFNLKAFD